MTRSEEMSMGDLANSVEAQPSARSPDYISLSSREAVTSGDVARLSPFTVARLAHCHAKREYKHDDQKWQAEHDD